MKNGAMISVFLLVLLGAIGRSSAATYRFTTIDAPNATFTNAQGINDSGQIVGSFSDGAGQQGFVDNGSTFTTLSVPTATFTDAFGNNNTGGTVGYWKDSTGAQHGFLYSSGTFHTFDFPGLALGDATDALGLNDAGSIVGAYNPGSCCTGFLDNNGVFTSLAVPGATSTSATDINNAAQIVGSYTAPGVISGGFLENGGAYTLFSVPGSSDTEPSGLNDLDQIVGLFSDATGTHGFLFSGGIYTTLDVPGATFTFAEGINNAGQIVGLFADATGTHGFLATLETTTTVPEPASLALLSIGLVGLAVSRQKTSQGLRSALPDRPRRRTSVSAVFPR